jgi:hypothetical protein
VVASVPRVSPSRRNLTPVTPTLSEAVALTVMVPETVAPEDGEVMATVGGVVSCANTVPLDVSTSAVTQEVIPTLILHTLRFCSISAPR